MGVGSPVTDGGGEGSVPIEFESGPGRHESRQDRLDSGGRGDSHKDVVGQNQ